MTGYMPDTDLPATPPHPHCPTCDVPLWLVKVELGEIAAKQECKACDRRLERAVPREQHRKRIMQVSPERYVG